MADLLTALREHDLPPRWNGHAVVWDAWEHGDAHAVFICPPPRPEVCVGCGAPTVVRGVACWSRTIGYRADSPALPHDDHHRENEARARLPFTVQAKLPRHWWITLHVYRCHHCQLDTVWDTETDEWWTLDHTDYGDEGSS